MAVRSTKKLELTWANKDMRLLTHGSDAYQWVDPTDWRVTEVRLLHEIATVGDEDDAENLLILGDATHALTSLTSLPEIRDEMVGKVKLCYIDPPFNTGQTFAQYDDAVEHSVWLTMLRDRLVQIKKLLHPDGSVWVHLDDVEQHRARAVMDEVFGAENFVATVIWEKTDSPRMDSKTFSTSHDYIHVFRKSGAFTLHQVPNEKSNATKVDAKGRPYYLNPLRARGGQGSTREARPNLYFGIEDPDGNLVFPKLPDGSDGAWRWSEKKLQDEIDEIEWTQTKGKWSPNYRIYEEEGRTRPPSTLWPFKQFGSTRTSAKEIKDLLDGLAFATPKPERLLEAIITIATDPGDLVLDCFAGSGTTAAVAHKLKRRWVTVELAENTASAFVLPRLTKVVNGEDPGGISTTTAMKPKYVFEADVDRDAMRRTATAIKDLDEEGAFEEFSDLTPAVLESVSKALRKLSRMKKETTSIAEKRGGFRVVEVAPSMFEEFEDTVVLADWVLEGELGAAVAAQLGYTLEVHGPFVGKKGRSRLAVLDGVLTSGMAEFLVSQLDVAETVVVVAQSIEPEAEDRLRELRAGSRARKVPRDLAHIGRHASRLVRLTPGMRFEDDGGDDHE